MKRTALALLLATGLTASPVMAQQQHDHANQAAAQQQDHSGHMMQDSEAMTAHREKMAEMRALMQQARDMGIRVEPPTSSTVSMSPME